MTTEDLAAHLTAFISGHRHQRIPFDDVWAHATRIDPTLLGDPGARARLHDVLAVLADQNTILLPRTRTGYDTRSTPHLPRWISKPPTPRLAPAVAAPRVWPQPLAAAAALATRPDEVALLDRIAAWLRSNPDRQPVPIEERSLELLDDEKALGIEVGKRLFTSGALTLPLLACYIAPVPLTATHVPGVGETTLLVAENNATYQSLLVTARAQPTSTRPDRHIGWGSGNQFPVSIGGVALLDPAPTALYYFGDLDLAGLRIAVNAAATAVRLGLPPLRPHPALYAEALARGAPRPDKSNPGTGGPHTMLLDWLPADLRPAVAALLRDGMRIPQETVGLRVLRARPDLLAARDV